MRFLRAVRASTELCNKPEIKIKCLILHVSALLAIFGLFLKFYCQAAVEETVMDELGLGLIDSRHGKPLTF